MIRIDCIVGARPNFVKMAAILEAARRRPGIATRLIHTGQHFSPEMSGQLFEELEMPEPDINLGAGGGSAAAQTAEILLGLERVFTADRPDVALVVGDVNSTMAAAIAAVQMGIPVAHVEAGLRSFDRQMPEENNRLITDAIASWLFVTESSGEANLLAEGASPENIFFTGNAMIDTLLRFREKAERSNVLDRLGLRSGDYAVATLHRPSNVDSPGRLSELHGALSQFSRTVPVVFAVHPRTRRRLEEMRLDAGGVLLTPPFGYLDFVKLMAHARLVLTDSGGIQEETTALGVPCLTLRENTERPVTIESGTNRLVGVDAGAILRAARDTLRNPPRGRMPELWDGKAAERILDALESCLEPSVAAVAEGRS